MKSLLKYMKPYIKESILAPLFKMLEATFELLVPLVMAAIIDVGITNSDTSYVVKMCGILVLLGVVGLAASITAQYFAAKAAVGFSSRVRHVLFSHIQGLSFSQIDLFGTDTLITRMTSDVNQVQSGVNLFLRLFLRSPFVVLGALIMAFTVDSNSAMIFVVTIPVLAIVVFSIMLVTMPMYGKVQGQLDTLMTATRENLTGVRVIRAFNQEAEEQKQFVDNNSKLTASQQLVGRISGLMNPVTYVLINIATVILIYRGGVRIDAGILTQGQVIALLNYMSQILVELVKLANLIIQVTRAAACGNRIEKILEVEPDMVDGTLDFAPNDEPAVEFRSVSLKYKGANGKALDGITFTARSGQTIGIIGGTGSGKSTLVDMIPRFYDATEGGIYIYGENVKDIKLKQLRSRVGVVLQKAELFRGTIAENLKWGDSNADEALMNKAIEISQAREYVDQKPGKLDFSIEQKGRNLSGGQKQRLTIARALVKKPEILILDDSASALDFATDAKLRQAIKETSKSMTTFIVSQRAASVQYADVILVMDDGRLVGKGTHEELLKDNEVYKEIYFSQFPKEAVNE